jgi:hypothetical protein
VELIRKSTQYHYRRSRSRRVSREFVPRVLSRGVLVVIENKVEMNQLEGVGVNSHCCAVERVCCSAFPDNMAKNSCLNDSYMWNKICL